MSQDQLQNSAPPISASGNIPATSDADMEKAIGELRSGSEAWIALDAEDRWRLIDEVRQSFATVADRWVEACLEAEGIPPANPQAGEEWLAGPYLIFRNLRLLKESLQDIAKGDSPRIAGPIRRRGDGKVVARVFPASAYDRLFFPGLTAEVWMEPGVTEENLGETQAVVYREGDRQPGVSLVLGAGNVSSIGPMDALYKLFVEDKVVLYKSHPVNDYLGPLLAEGMEPLVRRGFLRVVYGGAREGDYLCRHEDIDEIHVTGSDKTVEAIVFGPGEEGERRKSEGRPRLHKEISSELGNVSPVIVAPGPWSTADLAFQGDNLASMLTNNAGFNCNAARVLITDKAWGQRNDLLQAVRRSLRATPPRKAYYPGAEDRWRSFLEVHPEAEQFGDARFGSLPWTLIAGLDPEDTEDPCFRQEAFCGLFGEVPLEASDPAAFLDKAVAFANDRLWGTLNATILIHPASLEDAAVAAAFERALDRLRYGTVAINCWAAVGYGLVVTPWGAHPGHTLDDIQSGQGIVHNTLMFSRVRKGVVRAPFRARPKPPWFSGHKTARVLGKRLTAFERSPSPFKLPGIFKAALGG